MNFKENRHDVCVLARDSALWKFNARLDDNVSIRCLQDTTLDAIIFGIKGDFTKITRLDSSKRIEGWLKRDVSYMVDLLYYILSEMGLDNYFATNVDELISVINRSESPVMYDPDDLPF